MKKNKSMNTRPFRDALLDADVSFKAKSIGFILSHYAISSDIVYPSIRTLSECCNCTNNTIQSAINELIKHKLIEKYQKIPKGYSQKVNHYRLLGVLQFNTVNDTVNDTVINTVINTVNGVSPDDTEGIKELKDLKSNIREEKIYKKERYKFSNPQISMCNSFVSVYGILSTIMMPAINSTHLLPINQKCQEVIRQKLSFNQKLIKEAFAEDKMVALKMVDGFIQDGKSEYNKTKKSMWVG